MINSNRSSASSILELMVITDRFKKLEDDPLDPKFIPIPTKTQLMQSIAEGELQNLAHFLNIYSHVLKSETVFQAFYEAIKQTHNQKRIETVKLFYDFVLHRRMSKFELMDSKVQSIIEMALKYLKISFASKSDQLKLLLEFEKRYLQKVRPLRKRAAYQASFMFELTGDPITLGPKFENIRHILGELFSYDTKSLRDSVALKRWSQEALPGLDFLPKNTTYNRITQIANEITGIQIQIFKRITPFDFNKNIKYPISYLEEARCYYNIISRFVENMILIQDNCQARVNAIFIFKVVLEKLLANRDFQSALAVYNSFSRSYVFRLKKTWELFKKHFKIEFKQAEKYEEILNDKHSFENAKKLFAQLDEAKASYIPLLNTYEGQIASVSENLTKRDGEGKVNCNFIDIFNLVMEKIFVPIERYPEIQLETDLFYVLRYIRLDPKYEEVLATRSMMIEPKTKREQELDEEEESFRYLDQG